jgi:hypothetical protein
LFSGSLYHDEDHASPVSLFTLNIVLTLYLFALNLFSNHGMVEIQAAVWPALVLLALGWLLALVHRWPFKLFGAEPAGGFGGGVCQKPIPHLDY